MEVEHERPERFDLGTYFMRHWKSAGEFKSSIQYVPIIQPIIQMENLACVMNHTLC